MGMMSPLAHPDLDQERLIAPATQHPWQTVVWNDPVNLMSYVVHVFRAHFGFTRTEAELLMLAVHHDGHAVVAQGPREQMELHAHAMHDYGLWATVRQAPE